MTLEAVRGDDGEVLDQIRLTGVRATGHHGVFASEREQGQEFVVDLVVHLDTRAAAVGDDLGRTVDYGTLAEQVVRTLESDPADLIETVAERVAAVALTAPAVHTVDVTLHKPQAPITVPFGDVAVVVRRSRTNPPVVVPVTTLDAAAVAQAPALPVAAFDGEDTLDAYEPVEVASFAAESVSDVPDVPDVTDVPTEADVPAPAFAVEPSPQDVPDEEPGATIDLPRERDRMDEIPASPVDVVLALGANVGDTQQTLRDAIVVLDAIDGIEVVDVSPLARTAAVGGPEQDDYLNAVVVARTDLSARELLHAVQDVEHSFGRERTVRWGPRTLDVDIIVYGTLADVADDLELPHPRAHERAFVLEPWSQVQPDAVLPGLGGGPVAQLAATAPDRSGIRWLALDWLGEEEPADAVPSIPAAPSVPSAPVAPVASPALPAPAAHPAPFEPGAGPADASASSVPAVPAPPSVPPAPPAAPPAVPRAELAAGPEAVADDSVAYDSVAYDGAAYDGAAYPAQAPVAPVFQLSFDPSVLAPATVPGSQAAVAPAPAPVAPAPVEPAPVVRVPVQPLPQQPLPQQPLAQQAAPAAVPVQGVPSTFAPVPAPAAANPFARPPVPPAPPVAGVQPPATAPIASDAPAWNAGALPPTFRPAFPSVRPTDEVEPGR